MEIFVLYFMKRRSENILMQHKCNKNVQCARAATGDSAAEYGEAKRWRVHMEGLFKVPSSSTATTVTSEPTWNKHK